MSTPIYPSALPNVGRVSLRPDSGVVADDGDGVKSFRRRSATPLAEADVEWTFVGTDFSVFLEFGNTTLLHFHKWFWLKLPSAGGLTWHVVRFSQGEKPSCRMNGHGAWTVSGKLDVRERAFETQPEPPVDPPPPPTGEPDVLSFLLFDNGNSYTLDQTRIALTDFDSRRVLTTADYATFNETTGVITLLQEGVYEVMCSLAFGGFSFLTDNVVVGAEIGGSSDGGFGSTGIASYPFSFPLVANAAVFQGGPSFPTPTLRQIINLYNYSLGNLPYIVNVQPFAYKQGGTGTYSLSSAVISVHRFGSAQYNPSLET